ncbi:MAG TPA: LemA family protein [Alphaproteobacteria bacterium]|nr:LemA family protein [Alphaproteobacteria bacterium]HNS44389.1 LemA family protein [Alphaproteobacteria bacterium]
MTTGLILIVVAGLVVLYAVSVYNKLVTKRAMTEESYSGIDVQLKRRADLIPNLVETVKGYMTHEQTTLEKVTAMRARAEAATTPDERFKAEAGISSLIGNIMAVAESYPELKASANFINLQGELSGIEEQIQFARRYYNGSARDMNIMIQKFPSNIVAGMFRFEQKPYFEIEDEADRKVQKVSFAQ